jgi:hypothetical protein
MNRYHGTLETREAVNFRAVRRMGSLDACVAECITKLPWS